MSKDLYVHGKWFAGMSVIYNVDGMLYWFSGHNDPKLTTGQKLTKQLEGFYKSESFSFDKFPADAWKPL